MSEDIDDHVLRKYEIQHKLGKGVSRSKNMRPRHSLCLVSRRMVLYGERLTDARVR